ncbi:TorD/DmsD family molecular chaperone [Desulfosporosinus meridiei]|uniref:Putative component of anaerobic dehydrogenase n=1 Tax=Desulfosporosinus meridiei (strain ATCC BAA-275 / DSM 13257 / KCTC 12902 / NCIMB 13706 / S10) TaxID=768704 RepID=J7IXL9_DESMD|nr:molecular chaperone TorD family protein [Desulfosporosinus meridiei]AFQ43451.1 putative component of anaerobic dehydrogenase [Desulfosporosinus meridiei DSM 13257]
MLDSITTQTTTNQPVSEGVLALIELRAYAYDVLRRTFASEPSQEYLELMKNTIVQFPFASESEDILKGIKAVDSSLNRSSGLSRQDVDGLQWDYTRLFIGPDQLAAPPWESAYANEDKLLFQKETLEVRGAYLKHLFLPAQFQQEADDHIGLELDFMYQLCLELYEKAKSGESFQEVLEDQQSFLQQHLLKWVPRFGRDIINNSTTDFYKGMASILMGYLSLDLGAVEELLTVNSAN